ncbi:MULTISPECIES: nucleotidyltransferase [Bacillus cereus group]|uniref:tRNA(Met) cytidine acetate ligase n=1 Tax=Bacillus thuringiensis subsp. medellin TaxID=79672 RepID=A0A9X6RH41_BACTV|nr:MULTISPECIES: nucleotidyltransferase [Bacillus cereus group]MDM5371797.1 nucleotidyltransferase [Bacillus bombysepticus]MCR6786033.1 nucleotidyltransferase [Bacillus thuringiensis]MCR6825665.1 nucleotidyltransferase [Bacillus thuringiensis]MCR6826552.1 nucleotidyltransferase [Bacillus thuringiensis]MEB8930014.1 nucleotidyltransferase [Bacillus cereus]
MQQTKKLTQSDIIIAVMSGPFLQRGEPALISKWYRTKMALANGVDLVVELPYVFATQKAETFANGAISILNALHVSEICFGSEDGQIENFYNTISVQKNEEETFNCLVKQFMDAGNSYAKATSDAFSHILTSEKNIDMSQPNNILGFQYMKAILSQNSAIRAQTIKRFASHYHDETFNDQHIASATSIRKQLFSEEGSFTTIEPFLPQATTSLLANYKQNYGILHNWEQYFSFFKYKLMTMSPGDLRHIYEIEEGLEHRILSKIQNSSSFYSFMEALKTKRYTWTRLQRACTHILTNTTKEEIRSANIEQHAPYIRLLGMSQKGQTYLSKNKKKIELPILTHTKTFDHAALDIEKKANSVYFSIMHEPLRTQLLKQDITHHPIRYDETTTKFL